MLIFICSGYHSGPVKDVSIKGANVVTYFTGMPEQEFKNATNATVEYNPKTGGYIIVLKPTIADQAQSGPFSCDENGNFILTNRAKTAIYSAGQCETYTHEYLATNTKDYRANKSGSVHIVVGSGSDKYTNIIELQHQAALLGEKAAFLVASDYDGIEAVSGHSDPSIDIYLGDPTQGPSASFGCFAGALLRLYSQIRENKTVPTRFFDSKNPRVHMLKSDFLDTQNGYVYLNRDIVFDGDVEKFLENNHYSFSIMYHKNQSVMVKNAEVSGERFKSFTSPAKIPEQTVDQILSAGLSLGMYKAGFMNGHGASEAFVEAFAQKILFDIYDSSIRAAIKNKRKVVYLLPIGCGVFGNKKLWAGRALAKCKELILRSGITVKYIIPGLEKRAFETIEEFNGFIDVIRKLAQETNGTYSEVVFDNNGQTLLKLQ